MVLAVGGNHVTSDIAHGLRLPLEQAEQVKIQHGYAIEASIQDDEIINVKSFGQEGPIQVNRRDLAHIIEARVEEIFLLVLQEIKRSGYDGLLPAGMVLTGGSSLLPGMRELASSVLGLPVRVAKPESLLGLADQLHSPAYSTSVGLLYWALLMGENEPVTGRPSFLPRGTLLDSEKLKNFLKRLLP